MHILVKALALAKIKHGGTTTNRAAPMAMIRSDALKRAPPFRERPRGLLKLSRVEPLYACSCYTAGWGSPALSDQSLRMLHMMLSDQPPKLSYMMLSGSTPSESSMLTTAADMGPGPHM